MNLPSRVPALNLWVTDRQILRAIGANVTPARLSLVLTQECLANLVGVNWQTISNIESGKFPFAITTFARISHVPEVSANGLSEGLPPLDVVQMEKIKKSMVRRWKPNAKAG